ncbi:uncharacterized protein V6R79_013428 [Siganus canaliculatus]
MFSQSSSARVSAHGRQTTRLVCSHRASRSSVVLLLVFYVRQRWIDTANKDVLRGVSSQRKSGEPEERVMLSHGAEKVEGGRLQRNEQKATKKDDRGVSLKHDHCRLCFLPNADVLLSPRRVTPSSHIKAITLGDPPPLPLRSFSGFINRVRARRRSAELLT